MRLLVGDPVPQYRLALAFLDEQIAAKYPVLVSDHVLAEAYFALQSYYGVSKSEALSLLLRLTQESGITATVLATEILALPGLATAKPGFVDRLIHGASQSAGHTLITFEKAAKKLPATVVLERMRDEG
ncbi:MAG: hypothetical protein NTW21_17520 [Verrucomicrobia bacterium]|nr:hypothetical protein [Verrucomicrobiota bacterium]